jgi:hypothetical protein
MSDSRWIPVTERIPADGVRVLAMCEIAGLCVAYIGVDPWDEEPRFKRWCAETEPVPVDCHRIALWDNVTHWMPLPAPPTASK